MTFSEMVQRCAEILDVQDRDDQKLTDKIKHAINVAYMTIARDKFRPVKSELASVKNGIINIKSLSESFVGLKNVQSVGGMKVAAWEDRENIHVSSCFYQVRVFYYFLPKPLVNDSDQPIIDETQVDPYAFIYFAAAFCLNIEHRHAEASVWDGRYRLVVENIKEVRSSFIMPRERWQ